MVINYHKFPILRYFEKEFKIANSKGFKSFTIDNGEHLERSLKYIYKIWDDIKELCRPNVYYISKTFRQSVYKSRSSFLIFPIMRLQIY